MSVDSLNKHVLQMLTHLNKYPIPDPQMVKDFNWFIKRYTLSVQSGEVTAPIGGNEVPPACDSCCPGTTVTETVLTFNGSTLSTTGVGASGFEISPTTATNKRLYGVVIEITGATTQDFSIYNSLTELSTSLSNGVPNIIGTTLVDNDPVPEEAIEAILTIRADSNESANDLSTITVTVKLYTA
jgi:hypothetical protein